MGVRISVILPFLDAVDTLPDQLEALANQSYEGAWELVLSDNGSSDGSTELARSWEGRLNLTVVDASTRRGSIGFSRNVAAARAHGEVLAFCDADDRVHRPRRDVALWAGVMTKRRFVALVFVLVVGVNLLTAPQEAMHGPESVAG